MSARAFVQVSAKSSEPRDTFPQRVGLNRPGGPGVECTARKLSNDPPLAHDAPDFPESYKMENGISGSMRPRGGWRFAAALGVWLCWAGGALPAVAQRQEQLLDVPPDVAAALQSQSPSNVEQLRLIESQVQRVAERALAATVAVQVGRAAGSGVIINKDGLVLTVAHVIGKEERRARILLPDGRQLIGRTLGANHDGDAGMVQLENPPDDLPFAPLAAQQRLRLGEWVVTTGQPGGIIDGRAPPLRLGRVLGNEGRYVRTDCALVGGDSGGPLFNMRGEVVGIHSSIGEYLTQNFHVPVTTFRNSWDRLLAGEVWGGRDDSEDRQEFYPVLGVVGRTDENRCLITEAWPDMPAANAGVQSGDVVTAVNGKSIESFEELSAVVRSQRPGRRIRLTIQRDEESVEIRLRLGGIDEPLPGASDIPDPELPDAERPDEKSPAGEQGGATPRGDNSDRKTPNQE